MELLIAIVYGLVQSLTELLPISSSGHLVILHHFLPFTGFDPLAFDVSLHLASVLAIMVFFWKDWLSLLFDKNIDPVFPNRTKTLLMIFVSTLPAIILGLLFNDWIENQTRSTWVVVSTLFMIAMVMIVVEKYFYSPKENKKFDNLSDVVKIGFAQSLALIPGVSRSGATITMAMALGFEKVKAAKISFMMAAPIIFGAAIFKIKDVNWTLINQNQWFVLITTWIVTFIFSLVVFSLLLKYLAKIPWRWFAYYRVMLAVLIAVSLLF